MNYNNYHFKKLLNEPTEYLIKVIMDSIIYLSPIKNTNNKGNTKYSIKDYIIGIIDICKNNTSWNSYCGYMKGDTRKCCFSNTFHNNILEQNYVLFQYIDTLRKKYNEWNKMGILNMVIILF